MTIRQRLMFVFAAAAFGVFALAAMFAYSQKAKPQSASKAPVSITVTASTKNPHDQDYHHCFEQDHSQDLYFDVNTDLSVGTINFVLWDMGDPLNPSIAESSTDWPVQNGQVKITVAGDHPPDHPRGNRPHLGPGPYTATLTASDSTAMSPKASGTTPSKRAGKVVGNAVYYYETWKNSKGECKYH